MMNRTFAEMDIGSIGIKKPFRRELGDVATLESSIRKMGLLYPIIVDRNSILISGERRLAACRNVGLTKVPVLRVDTDYDSLVALDIHSDMHLCRQPLSEDELHDLIERKKSLISGGSSLFTHLTSWFKGLFRQ